jgi:hypothetical protein
MLPCSIKEITIEAHLNPIMEINIMPWHLTYTLLGNVMLRPSDKLLKSCFSRHILECWGLACVVPLLVNKIKVNLDFHIFDVLDLDLLLGSPIEKLPDASLLMLLSLTTRSAQTATSTEMLAGAYKRRHRAHTSSNGAKGHRGKTHDHRKVRKRTDYHCSTSPGGIRVVVFIFFPRVARRQR